MTGGADVAAGSNHERWLHRSGFFREVVGYAEAVDLLNEPRMHANLVSVFEELGTSGTFLEVAAAGLLSLNGEEHKRYRSLIAPRFTPRAVEHMRPVTRSAAHQLITTFESNGCCEFVTEFATPYVREGTRHFVGFSQEEVTACWEAVELIASATKDVKNRRINEREQGVLLTLVAYAKSALEERHREPRGDILTLVADEVTRGSLPEPVALGIVVALLSAGHEPTVNQLGITVAVLSRQPEIWDALGTGELAPTSVIEAVLRFRSTNQGVARCVAEVFDYRGVRFEEGETILVNLAAANHDPRHFVEPDRLDLDAEKTSHLSFGFGPHHCLGAALARVQLQEAIGALTQRLTCPEILDIAEWEGPGLVGPSSLTVSFSSRDGFRHFASRD